MSTTTNDIPPDLLEILVCPLDYAKVTLQGTELICESCGRAYPVRDGIPVMLVEEARQTRPEGPPTPDNPDRTPGAAESAQ